MFSPSAQPGKLTPFQILPPEWSLPGQVGPSPHAHFSSVPFAFSLFQNTATLCYLTCYFLWRECPSFQVLMGLTFSSQQGLCSKVTSSERVFLVSMKKGTTPILSFLHSTYHCQKFQHVFICLLVSLCPTWEHKLHESKNFVSFTRYLYCVELCVACSWYWQIFVEWINNLKLILHLLNFLLY